MSKECITLVFDMKQKKPACVLLQAIYGCGAANGFIQMTWENWILGPTDDMQKVTLTKEEWRRVAKRYKK